MKKFLLLLIIPLTLLCKQDEKRLALVIGNANYDKGPLNNPVNDALLMKTTLENLDFEVIFKKNIETHCLIKVRININYLCLQNLLPHLDLVENKSNS